MFKIGVFDSGVGGITVLQELKKKFTHASFIYLGDTAHVPYGTRSPAQIQSFSLQCTQTLKDRGIDALVVACNTASSIAIEGIRALLSPVPVIGVVEPGIQAVQNVHKTGEPILILATRATIRSGVYQSALSAFGPILEQACPLLVPIIEEGWLDHPILDSTVFEYLKNHTSGPAGTALLACTHYPWIESVFAKHLPKWKIVNSAQAVTQALIERYPQGLSNPSQPEPRVQVEWIFTDPGAVPPFIKSEISSS